MNHLDALISAQKSGQPRGIPSICSAHPLVLEAALRHAKAHDLPALIEATCNQVNQFGGYTGMKPADFVREVGEVAERAGLHRQNLILGGDHLGPLVWAGEPAEQAMTKAVELVQGYVSAGFTKIHLDCSMPCADDRELPVERIAQRAARLAQAAEAAAAQQHTAPRYVIGTEVPAAGGTKIGETELTVTEPGDASQTIEVTRSAFVALGLESAWERVIALVVQPGVEFGDSTIHEYHRPDAAGLARFIETVPGMVYEAHSTDYQTRDALRALVEDHFAILKVGPGLTFALREAIFALSEIETILCQTPSRIRETLETVMLANPNYWVKHYTGDARALKIARAYSLSDRIRYYWSTPEISQAFDQLMANLSSASIPLSLVSQYLPKQYDKIRTGNLENDPRSILLDRVMDVLADYQFACYP